MFPLVRTLVNARQDHVHESLVMRSRLATWSPAHAFGVVLPLGAALTGLYLWKRSLAVVIVAHLLADLRGRFRDCGLISRCRP